MSLTNNAVCALRNAACENDHCDFAAMHATIHHLIYLLSSPVPQKYLEIFADIYINLDEL